MNEYVTGAVAIGFLMAYLIALMWINTDAPPNQVQWRHQAVQGL